MTETMIDTEMRWATNPAPLIADAAPRVDAWTTNEEIADQAARIETVYGNRHDIDTTLRLFRSQLRAAAMATAAADVGITAREREVLCDLYLDAEAGQDELEDAADHLVEELGVTEARAQELVTERLCEAAAASAGGL
jgi:hypothetical protein